MADMLAEGRLLEPTLSYEELTYHRPSVQYKELTYTRAGGYVAGKEVDVNKEEEEEEEEDDDEPNVPGSSRNPASSRPSVDDFILSAKILAGPHEPGLIAILGEKRQKNPPTAKLGALETFPLELLQAVVSHLDLRTLMNLRYTNRSAANLIDHHPQFIVIRRHAQQILRAALAIETGGYVTLSALHHKLHAPACDRCGDHGGYIYMLTFQRVCLRCWSKVNPAPAQDFIPITPACAKTQFGLSEDAVAKLPRMRAVPGFYGMKICLDNINVSRDAVYVDHGAAVRAGLALHGSMEGVRAFMARERIALAAMGMRALGDARSSYLDRYLAIVRMPWFNRASRQLEWARFCKGCKGYQRYPMHYQRQHTSVSFEEHLRECGPIRMTETRLGNALRHIRFGDEIET